MSETTGKKVLVIGGGKWQAPLIRKLHAYFSVVDVVDPNAERKDLSEADRIIREDIRNTPAIYNQIRDIGYELIISDQSDLGMESAVHLSDMLQLPSNGVDFVNLFLKKHLSRDFAKDLGIPVPVYFYSDDEAELENFYNSVDFDVFVKPTDAQASRGISRVNKGFPEEFRQAVSIARSAGRNGLVLVEEFIHGLELTAEGLVIDGVHQTLAISEKEHFRTGIASSLKYPAALPEDVRLKLIRMNDEYVNRSGIRSAITHAEYLYDARKGNLVLVEIACRGGGSLISSSILPWMSGLDIYDLLIRSLMGDHVKFEPPAQTERHALLQFFEFESGRISDISGIDEIRGMKTVDAFYVMVKPGDIIEPAGDDSKRHAMLLVLAANRAEMEQTLRQVKAALKVTYSTKATHV